MRLFKGQGVWEQQTQSTGRLASVSREKLFWGWKCNEWRSLVWGVFLAPPNFGRVFLRLGLTAAPRPHCCINSGKAARILTTLHRKSCFIISGCCFVKKSGVLISAVPCLSDNCQYYQWLSGRGLKPFRQLLSDTRKTYFFCQCYRT